MGTIQGIYNQYLELVKLNPVIAALVVPMVIAAFGFIVRGIPTRIYNFVKRQFSTSLVLTSQETGTNYETFISFMEWFNGSRWARWSRSYMIDGRGWRSRRKANGTEDTVGVGLGMHFFFYRGRLFWLYREMIGQEQQGYRINYRITLTMFGRNRQILFDLIEEFRWAPKQDSMGIYRFKGESWFKLCEAEKRSLDTVIVEESTQQKMRSIIEEFQKSREWYTQRGLAWKTTLLLEGPPGSGKSSFIKALASHFSYNLCLMNLNYMSDDSLEAALSNTPDKSFIVMEDFDDVAADLKRHNLSSSKSDFDIPRPSPLLIEPSSGPVLEESVSKTIVTSEMFRGLSLSGLLNALDGLVALDGKIIILTTNVPESLDLALLRKGRIDHRFHLGKLKSNDVRRYVHVMFPDYVIEDGIEFEDIMGCDLQALYFDNKFDAAAFVDSIPRSNRFSDIHYSNVATIAR